MLQAFLVGKGVSALLLTGLAKSFVKHCGALQLTTGWCSASSATPIGLLELCYVAQLGVKYLISQLWIMVLLPKVLPITLTFLLIGFPFSNVLYGLFSRWICEINLMELGNIPSGLSGYHFCICIKNSYGSENKRNKARETFNTHFYHMLSDRLKKCIFFQGNTS